MWLRGEGVALVRTGGLPKQTNKQNTQHSKNPEENYLRPEGEVPSTKYGEEYQESKTVC